MHFINNIRPIEKRGCACVEYCLLNSLPTNVFLLLTRQGPHFTCLYIPIVSNIHSLADYGEATPRHKNFHHRRYKDG